MTGGPSTRPFVSVVIPTYNRRIQTERALAALERQTYPVDRMEVIVVDDGSTDGTHDALEARRAPFDVRVLRHDTNRSPAAARNTGLAAARGAIVAFTDSDCMPTPGWVEAGVRAFDGDVAVVQGRTIPDPTAPLLPHHRTIRVEAPSGFFETCNIFYRADVLRAAGGFDESFRRPFGEDTAAGWAVRRLGVGVTFAPDAAVHHAVDYPGPAWRLRWARHYKHWPTLVRRYPEMRTGLLWARCFLKPRTAAFDLAVASVLCCTRARWTLVGALPYLWLRGPRRLSRHALGAAAYEMTFDAVVFASLLEGSVRNRTLVL